MADNVLVALVVGLSDVEEPAGVLHRDGVALPRPVGAVARLDDLLLDTHGFCNRRVGGWNGTACT